MLIDGFYAAYITGKATQAFAMLVFRKGIIVGADNGGVKYDGNYTDTDGGSALSLTISIPPNTQLVQGVTTGPEQQENQIEFQLPEDFLSQPFITISLKDGPVNVKFVKLRGLHE